MYSDHRSGSEEGAPPVVDGGAPLFSPDHEGVLQGAAAAAAPEDIRARFERFAPVIESLEQSGFADADAVHAHLAQTEQEALWEHQVQAAVSAALNAQLQSLEYSLQARVDDHEDPLSPEQAQSIYQEEATRLRPLIEQNVAAQLLLSTLHDQHTEATMSAAIGAHDNLRGAPENLARALIAAHGGAGGHPPAALADYLSQVIRDIEERAVASYVAHQGQGGKGLSAAYAAMPHGAGGGAAPAPLSPASNPGSSWSQILGIRS